MPKTKKPAKGAALAGLASIEYHGVAGASLPCEAAVVRLLQCGVPIPKVRILTCETHHALLLETGHGDIVAIKSGFSSGYGGTGPNCFSTVLQLLVTHGAELEEYPISQKVLERLDRSALRFSDLEKIEAHAPIRPSRCYDYILERHARQAYAGELWAYQPPVIPFALIDPRIMDLALEFWADPNARLHQAYCRLEDAVRARIGSDKHGARLFSEAFVDKACKLTWKVGDPGEATGRGQLFANAFQAYRNPRAHRENPKAHQLLEFLLLNHLFRLEAEAVEVVTPERVSVPSPEPEVAESA